MAINYSFELFEFEQALTSYNTIITQTPPKQSLIIDNFIDGDHFRTQNVDNDLTLQLEDRILTIILDESGSMTWNDRNGDRYIYLKRLLTKLKNTYPGNVVSNLVSFGGTPVKTKLLVTKSSADFLENRENQKLTNLLQQSFQDSVYDFAGVRVVRRTDRYPEHPADGIVVEEGILDAVKDGDLINGKKYYYGVWTFNKDLHFSAGKFISGIPRDRILPSGVNRASYSVRILPGIQRDNNVKVLYNFTEGSGSVVFDSSGNSKHAIVGSEVLEDNFWIGDSANNSHDNSGVLKNTVGARFDGDFDILESDINNDVSFIDGSQSLTVNLWVYRYSDSEQWVIGTSQPDSNNIGWALGISVGGKIGLSFSDLLTGFTPFSGGGNFVPEELWTMVTVTMNSSTSTAKLFINGISSNIGTISISGNDTSGVTKLYIGAIPVDSGNAWSGSDFFGSLNSISIHNITRSNQYISETYSSESLIFDQSLQVSSESPLDNNQREVLLSWEIRNDFNFQGGEIKILRKYRKIPEHENDGNLVVTQNANVGQFFFLDSFDFINSGDYYYRIFTTNSIGNVCDRSDARILSVHIPSSINSTPVPDLEPVSNVVITNANKKVMIEWTNPNDSRWEGTKIYFGTERFPTISVAAQGDAEVSDGFEILDTTDSFFVHRKTGVSSSNTPIVLENGKYHYYTIVTYDRLGRLSEESFVVGIPTSQSGVVLPSSEVDDLHIIPVNPHTLSLQWDIPVVKSDKLELFFGESALIFVNIRDIFGGDLKDIVNISLQVCTTIKDRPISTTEKALGILGPGDALDGPCGRGNLSSVPLINGGCNHGAEFDEECNNERETKETQLNFSVVNDGLIKGILTHISDAAILTRRDRYEMDVRAQFKVEDPINGDSIFVYNSEPVQVSFQHPLLISLVNKDNRKISVSCGEVGEIRGETICPTNNCESSLIVGTGCLPPSVNGAYINSTKPYIVRVELQYRGGSLPEGTPVNVSLFKHTDSILSEKSNKTFIQEGTYNTHIVLEPLLDPDGNPISETLSKSVVDIEIPVPSQPDEVDIYVNINYLGLFVDAIHTIKFVGSVFIQVDTTTPLTNGIDVAEQFATVWSIDPDSPNNSGSTVPVPDGTLVKWELLKLRNSKDRPFYSIEPVNETISGIYSTTTGGVARNVFFGPIGNIASHQIEACDETCCLGEEYAIKASVILGEESANDSHFLSFPCPEDNEIFFNKKLFINIAPGNSGTGSSSKPNYITWADGESMLHFRIAKNPSTITDDQIPGATCFRQCLENSFSGQLLPIPEGHIVQVSAPGEILWNVVFGSDAGSGDTGNNDQLISFDSSSIAEGELSSVASIPMSNGDFTDFYVRLNKFVGEDGNPHPQDCGQSRGGRLGNSGNVLLSCEWENVCSNSNSCTPTSGTIWDGMSPIRASSTLMSNNISITLTGGGGYELGTPAIMVGFKEPLSIRIIESRINGVRTNIQELQVDGVSQHTFVVEVTFGANSSNVPNPVPDGTPIELRVEGDTSVVSLSNCSDSIPGCSIGDGGIIYTSQVNDPFINPSGPKRSLAYFSIDPLPNIAFNAKIFATTRYDKLGTVEREMTKCVEVNNTINVTVPTIEGPGPSDTKPPPVKVTSNESIIYDTLEDHYSTVTGAQINRIGHFIETADIGTTDIIYLFGGFTDHDINSFSQITATSEKYDVASDNWEFITDMPTPRCNGMTSKYLDNIYCIGGLELDPISQQYVVSRKIESYNIKTNLWNSSLSPLPENLGVAFGNAQVVGENIYVLCGVNSVINNNQPDLMNESILKYNISSDKWSVIIPSNTTDYARISPFGFFRNNPNLYDNPELKRYYIYGGSVPKSLSQINAEFNFELNKELDDFRSFTLTSTYFLSLTESKQEEFILSEEKKIESRIKIPPYIYLASGFKLKLGSEHEDSSLNTVIDITDSLDNEWKTLPLPRDMGSSIYIPSQDAVYFMGGSNKNQSTTLNRVESIDLLGELNTYTKLTSFSRGRSNFGAIAIGSDIYFSGGLTSGHSDGYVEIGIFQSPDLVEALGNQSSGILITLSDDSGELIQRDIKCVIKGRLIIPELDTILSDFLANRAADRALGGDGTGTATNLPKPGDDVDFSRIIKAQNKVVDPNSDSFQFNSSKKLNRQISLFPIIYNEQTITIKNGVGGVTLSPRSEDPLANLQKLGQFIQEGLQSTPNDPNQRFEGDLTREELASLGDSLKAINLPPIILNSNTIRNLYQIETTVTIVDPFYFGQSVSDFDLNIQDQIRSKIETLLTPPQDTSGSGTSPSPEPIPAPLIPNAGIPVTNSDCFLVQNLAALEIPESDIATPLTPIINNPGGTGGFNQSGQCLFCSSLIPLNPSTRPQLPTSTVTFYNMKDWVPQIRKRLVDGHSLDKVLEELDIIDHETPFGSSQLYDAIKEAAVATSGNNFKDIKKVFYIASDNSENYSLTTRTDAINEINSVDSDKKSPVVYTVFSTSFPVSLTAQLERTKVGDIEKITKSTGGQSSALIASGFLDEVLNLTIGGSTGGFGWGKYTHIVDLKELSAVTQVDVDFDLPSNTEGYMRFRYSEDGFNFTDWTERFPGSQVIDFSDFFAKLFEFEIVLTTGFTEDIEEVYDNIPTGVPKLRKLSWTTSGERDDFIFLNKESIETNAQQVASSFEGTIPPSSSVEIGVSPSDSHDWRDFQNSARPASKEFGKTFLIQRNDDPNSIVPIEPLTTRDGLLYKTNYGSWDPSASVSLFQINNAGEEIFVSGGYRTYPRKGEIYFDEKQPLSNVFKISVINKGDVKLGVRLRNRLYTDNITVNGVGYMYSTNNIRPIELSQVAPSVLNVFISPKNPSSGDVIFGIYTYKDLNGNPEKGSVISWFKNGIQLLEIQNSISWENADLNNNNKLSPNDKIYFTITPSDGRDFGNTITSPSVTISARPPMAGNVTLISIRNNVQQNRFDTASTFKVQYTFENEDTGEQSLESGTIITWLVNGQTFKVGTFSSGDTFSGDEELDPRELKPSETSNGNSAHNIGNEISVSIVPKTSLITGDVISSSSHLIVNSIPIVSNVVITPAIPTDLSGLSLSFDFDDPDVDNSVGSQTDQSEIRWLFSQDGGQTFNEEVDLFNERTVSSFFLNVNDKWKAEVTGFDGLDLGPPSQSNIVTIQSS